jgi:hypothetical protein
VCGEEDINQSLHDGKGTVGNEIEDVIKGKRWFVEIDIAAWLNTSISCRDSTILLIKVDQGAFIEVCRGESLQHGLNDMKLIIFQ